MIPTIKIANILLKTNPFRFANLLTLRPPLRYPFTKNHKQGSQHQTHHEHEKEHKHPRHQQHDHHKTNKREDHKKTTYNPKQSHHQHGPGCKHDHHHPHEHHHHQAHPYVKLSKLTFEQLIQLKTDQSLKYAHLIYEQQSKKLKEHEQQKQHLLKNIQFYKKLEEEIKDKEHKLTQNIKIHEEEAEQARKRADKQIEESKNFAVTKIAKELLEVADCISHCRKLAEQTEPKDQYTEKVKQSHQVIKDILKRFDIEEFDPTGQQYNPNLQESLMHIPTPPNCKPNHVAVTMRTGYTIKGRLLRSARVGVFN